MELFKKKRLIIILAVLILLSGVFYVSNAHISEKNDMGMKYKKVLVIGIDGMDPEIIGNLSAEGKLPNLKALSEKGTFIRLNTSYPPHSPVAWTSIATGSNPGKHNIFDFIIRNPENYLPELSLAKPEYGLFGTKYLSNIKAEPFWKISSNAGVYTDVIRWPMTFPPEKVNGNMLSGLGVPDIKGFLNGYSYYTEDEKEVINQKTFFVENNKGIIETEISGPKTRKSGEITDIKLPIKIILDSNNSARLVIQGKEYLLEKEEWSDWIKAKFKIDFFKRVDGNFKAYLVDINPFKLYITTMQMNPENPVAEISYPRGYSGSLAENIGLYYTVGMPEETEGYVDNLIDDKAMLSQIEEIGKERDRMFWKEFDAFNKKDSGIFAFVYDDSDRIQHVFCDEKALEGRHEISKPVSDYFVKKDELIGKVVQEIDNETLLLIISDHGFTSFERAVSINNWLVENKYMTLTKDISELDEKDEGALFRYVDWSKTKAYSLGFNSIYLNLKGREGKGIVEESEKRKVADEIISNLQAFKDLENNNTPIYRAYKNEEIYKGNFALNGPDIVVGFNAGYRMAWETALGGLSKSTIYNNTKVWNGDHLTDPSFVQGMLISNIKLNIGEASQMDVAPTILDAVGIRIPDEMDGKSLL